MNIGFFVTCKTPESQVHLEIAKYMLASARKYMPDVQVVQFTDETTLELEGVDACVRLAGDMPMGIRRMRHYAATKGDWCFVDTDVIFQKDVREVFDEPFDVALTDRVGTYMEHTEFGKAQPYNIGVLFSRNGMFWASAVKKMLNYPISLQEWGADQQVPCGMVDNPNTPFDIIILPGKIYNFTPETEREDYSHAAAVHMKGARKKWMPGLAKRLEL